MPEHARPARRARRTLLERLEIHYLANPDPQLRFALLTDFADAPEEHRPEDEGYVRAALDGVEALNARYARGRAGPVLPLPPPAALEPGPGLLDGLGAEARQALRVQPPAPGRPRDELRRSSSGDPAALPRDPVRHHARRRHAAAPRRGPAAGRDAGPPAEPAPVRPGERAGWSRGYGVLQPRVSFHLTAATRSRFAGAARRRRRASTRTRRPSPTPTWTCSASAASPARGSTTSTPSRRPPGTTFPENQILSHDLIEGNYARCGLVTDIELFDDFPARYHAYARREHRWVRGDWQLLPWLGRRVPTADGPAAEPAADAWSAGRCSTTSAAAWCRRPWSLLLVLGWTVLPGSPWLWTLAALAVPALPLVQLLIGHARRRGPEPVARRALRRWRDSVPADGGPGRCCRSRSWPTRRGCWSTRSARTLVPALRHAPQTCWSGRPPRRPSAGWGPASAHFVATMWPAPALAVGAGGAGRRWSQPGGPAGGGAGPGRLVRSRRSSPTGSAGRGRPPSRR